MINIGSAQNLAQNLAYHFGGELSDYEQSLAEHHLLEIGGIRIGIVEPSVASGLESVLDLNPQNVKARIESGYKDAREQLTKMFGQS